MSHEIKLRYDDTLGKDLSDRIRKIADLSAEINKQTDHYNKMIEALKALQQIAAVYLEPIPPNLSRILEPFSAYHPEEVLRSLLISGMTKSLDAQLEAIEAKKKHIEKLVILRDSEPVGGNNPPIPVCKCEKPDFTKGEIYCRSCGLIM